MCHSSIIPSFQILMCIALKAYGLVKVTDFEVVCHAVVTIAGQPHTNPRLLQSKVVPAENRRDIFKYTTQHGVIHSFGSLRKGPFMFIPYLLTEGL